MPITVQTTDRIAVVTIARPEVRNAVDAAAARRLFDVFRAVDRDHDIDAAILTGAGGTYCAGFDLRSVAAGDADEWLRSVDIPDDWEDATAQELPSPMGPCRLVLDTPTIAAIEGHAVAGGLELALWCHIRVAARDAILGVFSRRWGVPLIDGGTVRLPRIIGQGRANDLILTGRPVLAPDAHAMGLVDRLSDPGRALDDALDLARDIARFPRACTRADLGSAQDDPAVLASSLAREWASLRTLDAEGTAGAERFASGAGRGGSFDV